MSSLGAVLHLVVVQWNKAIIDLRNLSRDIGHSEVMASMTGW